MEFYAVGGIGTQYGYDYGELTTDWEWNICNI